MTTLNHRPRAMPSQGFRVWLTHNFRPFIQGPLTRKGFTQIQKSLPTFTFGIFSSAENRAAQYLKFNRAYGDLPKSDGGQAQISD